MIEPAQRLRLAFKWIERERAADASAPLSAIIDRAGVRFSLSPAQLIWARWSLQPHTVAIQPKEPVA